MPDDSLTFNPEQRRFSETLKLLRSAELTGDQRRQMHILLLQLHNHRLQANQHLERMAQKLIEVMNLLSEAALYQEHALEQEADLPENLAESGPTSLDNLGERFSRALSELKEARAEIRRITEEVDQYGRLNPVTPEFEDARKETLGLLQNTRAQLNKSGQPQAVEAGRDLADQYLHLVFGSDGRGGRGSRAEAMRALGRKARDLAREVQLLEAAPE